MSTTAAFAGRPFATEDAGVLEARECELESYWVREIARNEPSTRGWWIQPGCGIGFHTQLAVGGGRSETASDSISSLALAGKTALRKFSEAQAGLALAYSAVGAGLPGQGFKYESTAHSLVVSAPIDKELVLHGNLGWSRSQSERVNRTTWALALERTDIVEGLDVGAEAYGDDRTSGAFVGIGARYAVIPEKFFVDFSYARQSSSARGTLATVGIKIGF